MHHITIQYGEPADTETFERHYSEVHISLASKLPGLRRFSRSHPRGLGGEAPYFVAELWFDEADALKAAMKSQEMAATADDAQGMGVPMTMFTGEIIDVEL